MMIKRVLLLAIPLAVLTNGGYSVLCSLTETWRAVPPSVHVMCMGLVSIGAAVIAIIVSSMERHRDA